MNLSCWNSCIVRSIPLANVPSDNTTQHSPWVNAEINLKVVGGGSPIRKSAATGPQIWATFSPADPTLWLPIGPGTRTLGMDAYVAGGSCKLQELQTAGRVSESAVSRYWLPLARAGKLQRNIPMARPRYHFW